MSCTWRASGIERGATQEHCSIHEIHHASSVAVAGGTAATTAVKFTVSPTCEGFLSDVRLVWLEVGPRRKT